MGDVSDRDTQPRQALGQLLEMDRIIEIPRTLSVNGHKGDVAQVPTTEEIALIRIGRQCRRRLLHLIVEIQTKSGFQSDMKNLNLRVGQIPQNTQHLTQSAAPRRRCLRESHQSILAFSRCGQLAPTHDLDYRQTIVVRHNPKTRCPRTIAAEHTLHPTKDMLIGLLEYRHHLTGRAAGLRIKAAHLDPDPIPMQSAGLPAARHEDISTDLLAIRTRGGDKSESSASATIAAFHDHRLGSPGIVPSPGATARSPLARHFRRSPPATFPHPGQTALRGLLRKNLLEFALIPMVESQLASNLLDSERTGGLSQQNLLQVFCQIRGVF